MEIHKPKPIHSWRELLGEIGVVVIGIVIALSGEQLVETIHHNQERVELRQALAHDNRQALDDCSRSIVFTDAAITWYVAQIDEARAAKAAHRSPGHQQRFHAPDFDIPSDPGFQAAASSGHLSLLTQEEIAAYSEAHVATDSVQRDYDIVSTKGAASRAFAYRFRQPDGTVDFSTAAPAEIDRRIDLLSDAVFALNKYRIDVLALQGLREALVRGERDLPALYRAERNHAMPVEALSMN